MLKIYNTLSKTKEAIKPIQKGKVNLYACGMTVYDYCHIGHARTMIAFDIVVRFLRYLGYEVKYVRNITDVDDKIIARANENKENYQDLTARFINAMHEDGEKLGLLLPDEEPKATENIPLIINMVETLLKKGYAYVGEDGDVYYDVTKFKEYGKLSHRNLEEMQSGSRVEVAKSKRNPLDFVLWKLAKPGEPSWESPWGKGRPGWHIECSVMSTHCLANHFDIHGGGIDLVFPHHENEIAQAEAATGEKFVNTWMHVGHLQVDKKKMSKSAGNFFTIREILEQYDPEVIRYFMISGHYRSPISYSEEALNKAKKSLERLYLAIREVKEGESLKDSAYEKRFIAAMEDDFNTPEALSVLFEIVRKINILDDKSKVNKLGNLLRKLANLLGILEKSPESFLKRNVKCDLQPIEESEINLLIEKRNQARKDKNWAESDRIRDELSSKGIVIEDGPSGSTWRRV